VSIIGRVRAGLHRLIKKPASDRMTIPPDQQASMERKVRSDPVLANAFRLMEDASLLMGFKRHSSALALASLSLEEIGKYLLNMWTADDPKFTYDNRKLHQMKQAAIGALFMTEGARKEIRRRGIDFAKLSTPKDIADLCSAVTDGLDKTSWFARHAKAKVIEYVKWSAIYYDAGLAAKGVEPAKITRENATDMMQLCSRSFMLIGDDGNVAIAKYVFPAIYKAEVSDP
jgi:AbiV family abortive infection protein